MGTRRQSKARGWMLKLNGRRWK
uniref:Uncharacterized protein n=1 Tax=Rhizophora mucronata TaxID=61149 RepID=A0A2P2QTY6_RHIMU